MNENVQYNHNIWKILPQI